MTSIALVTTTINIPSVLKLYRACDTFAHFFIMGDRKTPDEEVVKLLEQVPGHSYYGYDYQAKLGYKCHVLIGSDCIQRRNIGFLEALKFGADIIVSIDDDNIPIDLTYFEQFDYALSAPFNGPCVPAFPVGWFDPGSLLMPKASHRGFPLDVPSINKIGFATDAAVGVAAGMCLGDPDISAFTRMASHPEVHQVSELLRSGLIVPPSVHTVFNSQNTAVLRELIPAWFMWNGVGRMDDIYASLIVQCIMRERKMHVHFGKPFVYQQRNEHNLINDLKGEIDGYANVEHLAYILDNIPLIGNSVIDDCRRIWGVLSTIDWIPARTVDAANAYLDDCEQVL